MKKGQRLKLQMGFETEKERKKRIAREKKESEFLKEYVSQLNKTNIEMSNRITTDEFKSILWKEGNIYFNSKNRKFIIDENNKRFFNFISMYFAKDLEFEKYAKGELNKGLLIIGDCGTGKSSTFNIIQNISKKYNLKNAWFKNVSVHKVVKDFETKGEESLNTYERGIIHFDDLGAEKIANNWGVKERLFSRLIETRYNLYMEKGVKTYVTTNLSLEGLKKVYGCRFYDRLFEMFNFLVLHGGSRRY